MFDAGAGRRKIRRWLRLGPTRADLVAEAQLWKTRSRRSDAEGRAAHVRAKTAEKSLRAAEAGIEALLALLDAGLEEPRREDGCSKVRFHRQQEADDWAVAIAEASGEGVEAFNSYQCKVCPRSPVTIQRYWHAGHANGDSQTAKAARQKRRAERAALARRDGNLISQRVDPAVLDRLRRLGRED